MVSEQQAPVQPRPSTTPGRRVAVRPAGLCDPAAGVGSLLALCGLLGGRPAPALGRIRGLASGTQARLPTARRQRPDMPRPLPRPHPGLPACPDGASAPVQQPRAAPPAERRGCGIEAPGGPRRRPAYGSSRPLPDCGERPTCCHIGAGVLRLRRSEHGAPDRHGPEVVLNVGRLMRAVGLNDVDVQGRGLACVQVRIRVDVGRLRIGRQGAHLLSWSLSPEP